jgi:MalT-like TPR region
VLEAITLDTLGERPAALQPLRPALRRGAAGGFVRSFVDEGPPLVALLRAVRDSRGGSPRVPEAGFPTHYLDRLLAAPGETVAGPPAAIPTEPLSDREQEILTLLTEGLPNNAVLTCPEENADVISRNGKSRDFRATLASSRTRTSHLSPRQGTSGRARRGSRSGPPGAGARIR